MVTPSKKAVFLDRDGVLNEVVFRNGKPVSPRTIAEFQLCEEVPHVLKRLRELGYRLFVVSNQPDISRGLLDQNILDHMTEILKDTLPVERVLHCTHDDLDACLCRKPKPGMLHEIAEVDGIELESSFLVGDTWKDIMAGSNAGCKTVLLVREYNSDVNADFRIRSLTEVVDIVSQDVQ